MIAAMPRRGGATQQRRWSLVPYDHHVSSVYGAWMAEDNAIGLAAPALAPMTLDTFKASCIIAILTPHEAIAYCAAPRARLSVEHVITMRPPELPAYAELLAEHVMPAFL